MNDNDTLVVLVHGFCRNADDLQFWKENLSSDFSNIICVDMPATYSSFEICLDVLTKTVKDAQPEKYRRIFFAGHSMGGLLLREFLQREKPANAEKLVCVGTPHYGSKLADIALLLPGCGMIWKPLKALKSSARRKLTTPDLDGLKTGVIVGTNNAHWPGKLFFKGVADGLVEAFSAHATDAKSVVYVDVPHAPMTQDHKIANLIKKFFLEGDF